MQQAITAPEEEHDKEAYGQSAGDAIGHGNSLYYFPIPLDPFAIRRQFPALERRIGDEALIYLDSAASAQKPLAVLEAMDEAYRGGIGNAHRGMHPLAEEASETLEDAREVVRALLNAQHTDEIIFTKNCTEAINLVARSWGETLQQDDTIVLTLLEHHSNIVPWQQCAARTGATIAWIDIDDAGAVDLEALKVHLCQSNVRLVSITGQSNVLGVRPPIEEIVRLAHEHGALVLVDAAQLCAHHPIDVRQLDCDFLAFSGHKLYGPTGIGVLYGKRALLRSLPPFLGGGGMIQRVSREGCIPADPPARFEAGTPPVAQAAGLSAAIRWLKQFSWSDVEAHERALITKAIERLGALPGLRILGTPATGNPQSTTCISFVLDNIHPHDLTEILGRRGICLRAGHHCAEPLHRRLGVGASTRLSVGIYNTMEEVERVTPAIREAIAKLRP